MNFTPVIGVGLKFLQDSSFGKINVAMTTVNKISQNQFIVKLQRSRFEFLDYGVWYQNIQN